MTGWTKTTPLKTGFHPCEQCARGRDDCRSLAQIVSTEATTFMCVGEVKPGCSPEPRDQWALCIKGDATRDYCEATDLRIFVDRYDLSHISAVTAMGLATVIPCDEVGS
jgi:hypothetical protein